MITNFLQIMATTKHGTEGTMAKLVSNMPEVAYRALSNSMTSVGHPDSKDHLVRYNFMCLQNLTQPGTVNIEAQLINSKRIQGSTRYQGNRTEFDASSS